MDLKEKTGNVVKLSKEFQEKIKSNIATAIAAAFGFIIALYWKDIIVELVDKAIIAMNLKGGEMFLRILGALIATVICVVGIYLVSKWGNTEKS